MGPLSFPREDHVITKEPFLSNFILLREHACKCMCIEIKGPNNNIIITVIMNFIEVSCLIALQAQCLTNWGDCIIYMTL